MQIKGGGNMRRLLSTEEKAILVTFFPVNIAHRKYELCDPFQSIVSASLLLSRRRKSGILFSNRLRLGFIQPIDQCLSSQAKQNINRNKEALVGIP